LGAGEELLGNDGNAFNGHIQVPIPQVQGEPQRDRQKEEVSNASEGCLIFPQAGEPAAATLQVAPGLLSLLLCFCGLAMLVAVTKIV